jgi:Concanavalin A-like lectin/glucanases superfamily/Bacterial Ig-like domain/Calcineurin-like phosphoesterase
VVLTAPAPGASLRGAVPTFVGTAGIVAGDGATVIVRVYAGSSPTGEPVQSMTTGAQANGSFSVAAAAALIPGIYTVQVEQADVAGNRGLSAPNTFTITGYREEVFADSPSGYWRLGEANGTTAADETASHNNGTYLSGVTLGVPGALFATPNTAARFDGVDDRVSMGDPANGSLDFGTGDFTVEAWVKTTVNGEETIVSKQPSTAPYWQVTVTDDASHVGQVRATIDAGTWRQAYSLPRVDDGDWHQVVVVFVRASGITIYVDGTSSRFTSGAATGDVSNSGPFLIGKATGYAYFRGDIDEVSVYRGALSAQQVEAHFDKGTGGDRTAPIVALTIPQSDAFVADTTPTFSGTSGLETGDSSGVQVKVFAGTGTSGPLVATARATSDPAGAWAVDVSSQLPAGTYTARAEQNDSAGNVGFSLPTTFTVLTPPPPGPSDPLVLAAGDLVNCYGSGDEATAALLDQFPNAIVNTLGDHVYEEGTAQQFADCYEPSWGRAKSRTRPAVGDHEYFTPGASGYFNYFRAQLTPFGPSATDPTKGYYSYDLGQWHVVVLNGTCAAIGGCGAGSGEEQFVRNDLSAHPTACTMVTLHKPRWSSGPVHGGDEEMDALWRAFYDGGVDVVLSGDDHDFERFSPQTPTGYLDLARGVTQFVVGTGGRLLYSFEGSIPQPNSEVRNDDAFGVLKLRLRDGSYDWEFLPEAGKTFTDLGSRPCR